MDLDRDKIDKAVLALLRLSIQADGRVWKSFDWEVMSRLHQKGYISDPVGSAKSVLLTAEGERESALLLQSLFGPDAT